MVLAKSNRAACALLALSLALWGVPFGQVAWADDGLRAQPLTQEGAGGDTWDGLVDTSWYAPDRGDFTLTSAAQLAGLAAIVNGEAAGIARDDFEGKTVTLGADVKLNETAATKVVSDGSQRNWTPIGRLTVAGKSSENHDVYDNGAYFNGTFDGAGHAVRNIYRYSDEEEFGGNTGLFGSLGESAVVTRVAVEGGYLYGRHVGGIAAVSHVGVEDMSDGGPLIENCYNSATIEGHGSSTRAAGGIFGGFEAYSVQDDCYQAMARIVNCHNAGKVKGENISPIGGIAGYGSLRIENCLNTGEVTGGNGDISGMIAGCVLEKGYQNVGHSTGVGDLYGGYVRNCNSSGSGVLYHRFAESGDESKGDVVAVKKSEDTFFLADGGYWYVKPPAAGSYSVGDAFTAVRDDAGSTVAYTLRLRWRAGVETASITDGCIVGGVEKTYLKDDLESGVAAFPRPVVRVGGKTLAEDDDYTVSYLDPQGDEVVGQGALLSAGTYAVVVTGKGGYGGSARRTFSVEEVFLRVFAKGSPDAEPQLVKSYMKDDVSRFVASGDPVVAMFGAPAAKGGSTVWHVAASSRHVELDSLLADAGAEWREGATVAVSGGDGKHAQFGYGELHDGWYYPKATATGFSADGGVRVPAALALSWGEYEVTAGRTASYARARAVADQRMCDSPVFIAGVAKDAYAAGEFADASRLVSGVRDVTVTAPGEAAPEKKDLLKVARVSVADQVWTGKDLTPEVTVTVGGTKLSEGDDYKLSYSANRNVGMASVTVAAVEGSDKFTGAKKATFRINPKGTSLGKIASGKKRLSVSWKKQVAQVTGYQILLATNAKFAKGKKTVTVKGAKKAKAVVRGLKAKTRYWAKVRIYKSVGGERYYSAWSPTRKAPKTK